MDYPNDPSMDHDVPPLAPQPVWGGRDGIELRDWFAMHIFAAMVGIPGLEAVSSDDAIRAYRLADCLLCARVDA